MIGAIIGDIVGSIYEFNNIKTTEFNFYSEWSHFTDDTVCTIAFMDMFNNEKTINEEIATKYLRKWVLKYQRAGYGGRFKSWMYSLDPHPYNSLGNGSAMRVSSVAWVANSEEEVKRLSDIVTGVTHNHPEGMKGARVTALCTYLALHGATKEEIKNYAISEYPIIASLSLNELRESYSFNETAKGTVPQAIFCFLESSSFEDCIRKAISIGGDSDTLGAISGTIAEAYYSVPESMLDFFEDKLTGEMLKVVTKFAILYKKPAK